MKVNAAQNDLNERTKEVRRTPTPWRIEVTKGGPFGRFFSIVPDEPHADAIIQMVWTSRGLDAADEANAEYIVRTVNAHEALVAALKCCENQLSFVAGFLEAIHSPAWDDVASSCTKHARRARAALALAEGSANIPDTQEAK